MVKDELNTYAVRISQATRTGLVVLTYELALAYIGDALSYFETGDTTNFRDCIRRSRECIGELISTLDMKYAQSAELLRLYLFINRELNKADIRNNITELGRIKGILEKLMAAFTEVAKKDSSEPLMQNTQQIYAGLTYSGSCLNETVGGESVSRGYSV